MPQVPGEHSLADFYNKLSNTKPEWIEDSKPRQGGRIQSFHSPGESAANMVKSCDLNQVLPLLDSQGKPVHQSPLQFPRNLHQPAVQRYRPVPSP